MCARMWPRHALCCLGLATGAAAFPSFRSKVPNGLRVACPAEGEGCSAGDASAGEPAWVCGGLGHRTCAGATMPLNPFGVSLQMHNHTWSAELCQEDSDGDGLTNGEELGDPCCLWEEHDTPSAYTAAFAATHPGFADSRTANYVRPSDCSATAPAKKAARWGQFNPWEEQRVVELFIDNYSIPARRTTYADIAFNFPDDSADLFHVILADALIRSPMIHHFRMYGCSQKWPTEVDGKVVSLVEAARCLGNSIGAWAPGQGQHIVSTPPWLGRPIGSSVGIIAFRLNIHFDNPTNEEGAFSSDGIRILYTPTLRSETLRHFPLSKLSINPALGIPAGRSRYFITRSCRVDVADSRGQPAEFHVAGIFYHAHLLARGMYTELTQGAATLDLGSAPIWHSDDQAPKNILPMNVTLQTGDHVQFTCVFDSRDRTGVTPVGFETRDEMCWGVLQGWPGDLQLGCHGHLWTGELDANESGFGLASRHPESAAADVWDGQTLQAGGGLLKGGRKSCYDLPLLAAGQCRWLARNLMEQAGGEACSVDMGRIHSTFRSYTLLTACCTEACRTVCADDPICPTSSQTAEPGASAADQEASGAARAGQLTAALLAALGFARQ